MMRLIIGFGLFFCVSTTPLKAQGDTPKTNMILAFFAGISDNIDQFIDRENKKKLGRYLKYFANDMDALAQKKEGITELLTKKCSGSAIPDREIQSQVSAFNYAIEKATGRLETIRDNIVFDSDYNIVTDTVYVGEPVGLDVVEPPGSQCYIKLDSTYGFQETDFNSVAQRPIDAPVGNQQLKVERKRFCPQAQTTKQLKPGWKAINFEEVITSFKYSLQVKGNNVQYFSRNCDVPALAEETRTAVRVIKIMRDKALELSKQILN